MSRTNSTLGFLNDMLELVSFMNIINIKYLIVDLIKLFKVISKISLNYNYNYIRLHALDFLISIGKSNSEEKVHMFSVLL